MVNECNSKVTEFLNFDQVVDAFECIGRTAKTSEEALQQVVALDNQLADMYGISDLQASLFSARIVDYKPKAGATASQIHEDLVAEMEDVLFSPQARNPVNDTSKTDIAGLDRLRAMNAGEIKELHEFLDSMRIVDYKPKFEAVWPRNEVGAYLMRMQDEPHPPIEKVIKLLQEHLELMRHKPNS